MHSVSNLPLGPLLDAVDVGCLQPARAAGSGLQLAFVLAVVSTSRLARDPSRAGARGARSEELFLRPLRLAFLWPLGFLLAAVTSWSPNRRGFRSPQAPSGALAAFGPGRSGKIAPSAPSRGDPRPIVLSAAGGAGHAGHATGGVRRGLRWHRPWRSWNAVLSESQKLGDLGGKEASTENVATASADPASESAFPLQCDCLGALEGQTGGGSRRL